MYRSGGRLMAARMDSVKKCQPTDLSAQSSSCSPSVQRPCWTTNKAPRPFFAPVSEASQQMTHQVNNPRRQCWRGRVTNCNVWGNSENLSLKPELDVKDCSGCCEHDLRWLYLRRFERTRCFVSRTRRSNSPTQNGIDLSLWLHLNHVCLGAGRG